MMSASRGGRGVAKKQINADEGEGGVRQLRTSIVEFPPLRNWPPHRGLWRRLLKFHSTEEIFIVLCVFKSRALSAVASASATFMLMTSVNQFSLASYKSMLIKK